MITYYCRSDIYVQPGMAMSMHLNLRITTTTTTTTGGVFHHVRESVGKMELEIASILHYQCILRSLSFEFSAAPPSLLFTSVLIVLFVQHFINHCSHFQTVQCTFAATEMFSCYVTSLLQLLMSSQYEAAAAKLA
jgi:hypothetical protein